MIVRVVSVVICGLALNLVAMTGANADTGPTLEFSLKGEPVDTLDLEQLSSELTVHDIELYDPHYEKPKRFRAFAIADVMDAGYGDRWRSPDISEVVFVATDGYRALSQSAKLTEAGGYLAFEDLDQSTGWEPISRREVNPGPFYLVWLGEQQTTANSYPWPWQLARIDLVEFRDQYPEVYPEGAIADSSAMRGYELFKSRCLRCHAMNRQGGKIGPDLNAPMSITEYRSPMMIREFIRHPSRYRHSHMPDHEDLSEQDLDDLLEYFYHQARAKRPPPDG